jgi:hypothetical protein
MRASYRKAIEWIAMHDGNYGSKRLDIGSMQKADSVALVAHLWDKDIETVAEAVVKFRFKNLRK